MCQPRFGLDSPMATISSGARYGKGRSSSARTQLKIVAFTPMPSVRQRIAATENAGLLARVRRAKRKSESMMAWKGHRVGHSRRLGGWNGCRYSDTAAKLGA